MAGSANLSSTARCGRTALAERGAGVHVFPAQIIHEPAAADGRAAARVEDSLRALGSPLPTSRGARTGTPAPPATRWGHLRRGCRLRTGLQRSLGSWRRAGVSEGMRLRPLQRAQRLAARRVGAADHPRGASQIRAPRLRAGRGAEHDERIFRPRNTPRIRCRQVVAPPALEALSGRGVAATTQRSRTWHAAAPSKHLAAALL